jgi:hypothetical protein
MMSQVLLFAGALLTALWGIAHLFATKSVVKGFGEVSADNKNIITMEWIVEGFCLIFIGVLVAISTLINPQNEVSIAVYITSAIGLIILAVISIFTGFKVKFIPFRLCPFIFTISAVLILAGAFG